MNTRATGQVNLSGGFVAGKGLQSLLIHPGGDPGGLGQAGTAETLGHGNSVAAIIDFGVVPHLERLIVTGRPQKNRTKNLGVIIQSKMPVKIDHQAMIFKVIVNVSVPLRHQDATSRDIPIEVGDALYVCNLRRAVSSKSAGALGTAIQVKAFRVFHCAGVVIIIRSNLIYIIAISRCDYAWANGIR